MTSANIFIIAVGIILVPTIIYIAFNIFQSPFHYPYYDKKFDVSGKRNPDIENLIEDFFNKGGFEEIIRHRDKIQRWKRECAVKVENSLFQNLRRKQYLRCVNDKNAYGFSLTRMQTRYTQENYVKSAYKVSNVIYTRRYSYESLLDIYQRLSEIGFEATLQDYHRKEQRRLMTKQLRDKIAQRDNFRCQLCGKRMEDGVGLQIDHIIPIAKGGKTVPSNLQVLCSKCNGRKSSKTIASYSFYSDTSDIRYCLSKNCDW